jgi:ABC-2 type transport system permease protein
MSFSSPETAADPTAIRAGRCPFPSPAHAGPRKGPEGRSAAQSPLPSSGLLALRTALYDAKLNLLGQLEYRGAFLIWVLGDLARALISLAVWLTVSDHSARLPLDRSQLVTYFVAQGLVSTLTISWLVYLVPENIREGHLSAKLLRPSPPLAHFIANNLGEKALRLPLLVPLTAAVALLFGADLRLPADARTWALFAAAVVLAAVVAFLLDLVLCSMAFWLQDVWGLRSAFRLAEGFLDGGLIPLALFPPWLFGLMEAQPFRYTLSFPLEILTGALSADALSRGFAWQAAYAAGLYALYRLQWRHGLRAYSATGA